MIFNFRISSLLILLCSALPAFAAEFDYLRDIKPLLSEKCAACHGALQQEAGLRLDHGALLRRGGDEGPVVDPAEAEDCELMRRVSAEDLSVRMPPEGEGEPLNSAQLNLLKAWIAAGAESPDDEVVPPSPAEHWAWQLPAKVNLPSADTDTGSENPIDAFVYAKLKERGVVSSPLGEKRTLLRRVYFDLIGLPPTLDEQQQFLDDVSANAWPALVNRLLEDPAYGERWARHWMDVWRYSDWSGYKEEVRGSQRHIWRWRDWIIESLNGDKGYDQMIVEMLAGDEVAPEDPDVLRATGFLARNYHNSNRDIWLDATVEHTAKAFLGMTLNCARCHDHKYDPLSQQEYYAFRAIFEPHHVRTLRLPEQPDTKQDGVTSAFDAKPDEPTYLYVSGNEKHPDKEHPMQPTVPSVFGRSLQIAAVQLPDVAVFPSLRAFVEQEELAAAERKVAVARKQVQKAKGEVETSIAQQSVVAAKSDFASLKVRWQADKYRYGSEYDKDQRARSCKAAVLAEHEAKVERARLAVMQKQLALQEATESQAKDSAGDGKVIAKAKKELDAARKRLDELSAAPKDDAEYTPVGEAYPATSTGRRLALAGWIADRENPLTARIAVNYVWMHHFGEPLVKNVFDFGLRSPEPIHRELLDWLSLELMEHDWSFKHLHRLILNSRTYRLASSMANRHQWEVNQRLDPDNELMWRANVRRLEAEVIRDSLLHVAGNLDQSLGGPDIDFREGEIISRRSVYFRHAYEKQMMMLVLFDAAAPTECYRRSPSVVPQQALALANSPLSFDQARALAQKLSRSHVDKTAFVQAAFQHLLGRECTSIELETCTAFLQTQESLLASKQLTPTVGKGNGQSTPSPDPEQRARENLIHTLMNHNDFVTVR